jgi:hypothetical protein
MPGPILKRLGLSLLLGIIIGAALSELTFIFLRETARAPMTILLTIPAGTADQIARGEQPAGIPGNMTFVVGDILEIKNEDLVEHQLGPVWIPAGASAQLELKTEENLAYECSFQARNYFGLDVHEPLTIWTRLYGILIAGVPLGLLIAVYSFVTTAGEKKTNES